MPQRRINTPIPSFSAGWGEWTPIVLTWYDISGIVCAPPTNIPATIGRYRVFQGMVEYELFVTWLPDVADVARIFETPLPIPSGLPVIINGQMNYYEQCMLDIIPAVPDPISYGGFGVAVGGACDCIRNVINSGPVNGGPIDLRYLHLSGYYPVVIP